MRTTAIGLVAIVLTITVAWTALNAAANTSGPDPSGYTWTDSNAPDPSITFDWIDITTTGTLIDKDTDFTSDDDGVWTQPLPFDFNFFGNTYDTVQISTNGFISFTIPNLSGRSTSTPPNCNENYNYDFSGTNGGASSLGWSIPHGDANCIGDGWGFNPLIAGWFDDFDLDDCGEVYYGTNGSAPNRMFIVQWDDVCHIDCDLCAAGGGVTFEIILYEGSSIGPPAVAGASTTDGNIRIQYADGFFEETTPELNNGASATTGLSFDGDTGLHYSFIAPVLTDGLAVLYSPASETTATPTTAPTATPAETPEETETPTASPTATPTPTETPPAGQSVTWANNNCRDGVGPVDALIALRFDAGLPANTNECPPMGASIDVLFASLHLWGDVDCSGAIGPVDALKVLRHDAGLDVSQAEGCPEMGSEVTITVE